MNKSLREKKPLVHCITNYVTVNDVANAILACGGSPIMADAAEEVGEIVALSAALVINIGTLNGRTLESMLLAGKCANEKNIPVVLDPVGAGASSFRGEAATRLLSSVRFAVLRGNAAEISFCVGSDAVQKGVDGEGAATADVAKKAAQKNKCVCVMTGARDIVTDGEKTAVIDNGVSLMKNVTGTGCMLSGILGAYVGANGEPFAAAIAAVMHMGIAGEISFAKHAEDIGGFHIGIIDALGRIDDAEIKRRGKIFYEK